MTVNDLQKILSEQRKDSIIEFGPIFKDKTRVSAFAELESYCAKLYDALIDAKKCVELLKDVEEETKENAIYYDKRTGSNGGSRALNADLDDLMNKHHEKMLYFSLIGQ